MKSLNARGIPWAAFRAVTGLGVLLMVCAVAQAQGQCQSGGGRGGGGGTFQPSGFGGGRTGPTAGFRGGTSGFSPLQTIQIARQFQQMRRQAIVSSMRRRPSRRQLGQRRQQRQNPQLQFRRSSSDSNPAAFASVATDETRTPRERRQARIRERQDRLKAFREKQRLRRDEYRQRRATSGT